MITIGCKDSMFRKVKFVASVRNETLLAVLIAVVYRKKIPSSDI